MSDCAAMWRRSIFGGLIALALSASAADLAVAQIAAPSPTAVFRRLLLSDPETARPIKTLLREQGGFVRGVTFSDLTGDKKSDAVVTVASGGAAGNVALYFFTADGLKGKQGTGTLRAVYRLQSLYRAAVSASGTAVVYKTPNYDENDDLSNPSHTTARTVRWNKTKGAFRVTSTKRT
jgi:hypothetical protein